MSSSYTYNDTSSQTFTITHARHMAAKVAADLKRLQRLYGVPSDKAIADYEAEMVEFLKAGFLGTVTYGFRRNDQWIEPTLRYTTRDLAGGSASDDDPGKIRPGANVSGASFYSYMSYSTSYSSQSSGALEAFLAKLPFRRSGAPEPGISGYLENDRTYSAGGRALGRASVRSAG